MDPPNLPSIYSELLQLNRQLFEGGEIPIAYHALAAALHCAEALEDVDRLGEVSSLAKQQGDWLDKKDPQSRFSNKSASARGNTGIFASAAHQANAAATRIAADRAVHKAQVQQREGAKKAGDQ